MKTVGDTKIVDDIRMVYDATKFGLNDSVWILGSQYRQ